VQTTPALRVTYRCSCCRNFVFIVKRAGLACPDIPPQFLTLLLLSYIYFVIFLYVLFDRKKHQKLSAQVEQVVQGSCS
jgi:hypothetical protein